MCIIVAKEKGIEIPSKETLETCFKRNPDGAGFMYVKDGKVVIDKGYMDFKSFYKRLQKLDKKLHLKNKALVMHFRIGTHGENDKETTHPFPISNKIEDLRKTYITTDLGMAHNGVISNYDYDKVLSDTQSYIKDFISVLKGLNKNFYKNKATLDLLKEQTSSRLCFLDTKNDLIYVGNFVKDGDGVRYSNETYKPYTYNYNYGYDYGWKEYKYPTSDTSSIVNPYNWYEREEEYDYDNYYNDRQDLTLEEFMEHNGTYTLLKEGDIVEMSDGEVWNVELDDTYIITDKGDVYEYYDKTFSLIATGALLVNDYKNYFSLKECEC